MFDDDVEDVLAAKRLRGGVVVGGGLDVAGGHRRNEKQQRGGAFKEFRGKKRGPVKSPGSGTLPEPL